MRDINWSPFLNACNLLLCLVLSLFNFFFIFEKTRRKNFKCLGGWPFPPLVKSYSFLSPSLLLQVNELSLETQDLRVSTQGFLRLLKQKLLGLLVGLAKIRHLQIQCGFALCELLYLEGSRLAPGSPPGALSPRPRAPRCHEEKKHLEDFLWRRGRGCLRLSALGPRHQQFVSFWKQGQNMCPRPQRQWPPLPFSALVHRGWNRRAWGSDSRRRGINRSRGMGSDGPGATLRLRATSANNLLFFAMCTMSAWENNKA